MAELKKEFEEFKQWSGLAGIGVRGMVGGIGGFCVGAMAKSLTRTLAVYAGVGVTFIMVRDLIVMVY